MLNRRRGRLIPVVKPENPTLSISILNSDNKHSDDLTRAMPQLVRGDEIVGLNSVEVNIIRFRNLKKKTTSVVDLAISVLLFSQIP